MESVVQSADARRAEIQAYAEKIGIDDAYISVLVETFYEKIRENPLIGPIFDEAIGDDWAPHLARMKDFWASVALNAGRYSGKPMPKHKRLSKARAWHFEIWLALFEQTLKETAPSPLVVDYFMERANRIAQSLKLGMFGAAEIVGKK
ncbi:MAG: hypothetical protein DHS20C05_25780 [Hyphococcus sp.]|nr:MAG: hypothetical protein DHS20C05_25780 [Marinicaulis sp.]